MKKTITLWLTALLSCCLVACGDGKKGGETVTALEKPTGLTLVERVLDWDKVDGASGYVVELNGVEYQTTEDFYKIADGVYGLVSARVKAVQGKRESGYTQKLQETISWKLPTPTNLKLQDDTLTWSEIALAQGYIVSIDGVQYFAEENYQTVAVTDENEVRVLARGNVEGTLISSDFSAPLRFPVTLATPENLRFENENTLVWDAVEFATGYTVFNNGETYATVTENRFEIPAELLNADISELQIRADAVEDIPSEKSEKISVGKISERNPKLIGSVTEFLAIGEKGFYKLTADIDLSILSSVVGLHTFKGTLDGNGFKIKNTHAAVFEKLDGATVKNLTVENSVITRTLETRGEAVGALAKIAVDSTVSNCNVSAKLTVASQNGVGYVGGVFGVTENTDISSVQFVGELTVSHCVTGGFIGKAFNPVDGCEIKRSSATATIALTGGETTYCGGFIGQFTDNSLTVFECKADVEITSNAAYCGGFVGYMGTGKVQDCYVLGSVENTNETLAHVGGFIGRTEGYNNQIIRCIAMVSLSANDGKEIKVGGFVGSTVGGTYASVYTDCYYDKTLAPIDRIGNPSVGKGDGITKKSTSELTALEYRNGYLATVWKLGEETPALAWEK